MTWHIFICHTTALLCHRLYDAEVVDLSPEVSFLIVVPRAESACAVPGQTEALLQRGDLIALPVQVFEMVHLGTYQRDVISRYSRLSCILELDTVLAHHSHREVCSSSTEKFHSMGFLCMLIILLRLQLAKHCGRPTI